MPVRNNVPTLRLLSIRQLVFPENLVKEHLLQTSENVNTNNATNSGRRERRVSIFQSKIQKHPYFSKETMIALLQPSVESLVNAWIRLSDYYETRLDDIKHLRKYLSYGGISTLDFLHEGFSLHDGTDVASFAGVLSSCVIHHQVTPYTWKEIVKVLQATGNLEALKNLFIDFGFKSHSVDDHVYHFKTTFSHFINLTKLIVHGKGNDNLMIAVGIHCVRLKYLDIRETEITEKGILSLLLKSHSDAKKFNTKQSITYPAHFLNPLTRTIQYFDMSTVPREGLLLPQNIIVLQSCPQLVGTANRFYFRPDGVVRFNCISNIERDIKEINLRNEIMYKCHPSTGEPILSLTIALRTQFSSVETISSVELRIHENGEEATLLYFHRQYVILEFKYANLTIISVTSHARAATAFIPLQLLVQETPNIKQIKAPLKGELNPDNKLNHLERLTSSMIHKKETLLSILKYSSKLVYFEVHEMLLALRPLNDEDVLEIFQHGEGEETYSKQLEVFRLLFKNKIHIVPGLKEITLRCPVLRIIGDLKYWKIPTTSLSKFSTGISSNNYDLMFEYQGLLYHTNTPCKEFYR